MHARGARTTAIPGSSWTDKICSGASFFHSSRWATQLLLDTDFNIWFVTSTESSRMVTSSRVANSSQLPLGSSTQMDEVLPFLRSVPAENFLGIIINIRKQSVLVAHECEPCRRSQEEAQHQLLKIIHTTLLSPHLSCHVLVLQDRATKALNAISFPLRCGLVFQTLASLGTEIARTATMDQFYTPSELPPRTPTECLATILDVLEAAQLSDNSLQQAVVVQCIKNAETSRLHAAVNIKTITKMLKSIQDSIVDLDLQKVDSTITILLNELRRHGSFGPYPTRLHDNMYGRVWETALNAKLTEEPPPRVIQASRIMRMAFFDMVRQVPKTLGHTILANFLNRLRQELPRPWSDEDRRIQELSHVVSLDMAGFEDFLRKPTESGSEVAGDYFVGKVLFDTFKEIAPDVFPWRAQAGIRYREDIVPLKGNEKFHHLWTDRKAGCGITLAHHINVSPGQPSMRGVLRVVRDLDSDITNTTALKQGIPVGTGISGYTHLFTSFFLEMMGKLDLDLPHAILGLQVFLVVDGGHSWNEGLLALEYLERKLHIGFLPVSADVTTNVAVYHRFMSIFDVFDTKGGGQTLPDETPHSFLYSTDFLPLQARTWARNFTKGCNWMSSGLYQESAERSQSLYCFPVNEDSVVECRLRQGDPDLWELPSVLIPPASTTSIPALPTPKELETGQMLQGGVIYHKGAPAGAGAIEGDGFLVGELRCALTIIVHHLRSRKNLPAANINPVRYTQNYSVRIVSITDTSLRVLDVRYDPSSQQASCRILISIELSAEREEIGKLQRLDSDWARAIAVTLGLKEEEVQGK
ncbi:hypothetical protein DL98DRAFT_540751 [Cadophora sp. DSE1049]|nr:hypothetical protein DL98DRAFT_540751 [Cadophora sp. DSE1049]